MVLKRVLIIDDEENIRTSLKGVLQDEGFLVETAKGGPAAYQLLKKFTPDVILLDIWMPEEDGITVLGKLKIWDPDCRVIMMSGHGTVETAVKAIKLGAFDFLEKPLHFDKILVLLKHVFDLQDLQDENRQLRQELREGEQLIGDSIAMARLRHLISVTGPSSGWVLIEGENGTGKELVARSLHHQSLRARERFVAVNCAAIPDELIESELFGHEKGAFTGAHDRKIGKFELAHGGTLFLDEVGDMGAKMQAKILRALQECTIQRVGGDQSIEVDIRVIAATNKDLKKSIRNGEFREDLYYRLKVIPIMVPPLRERKEDLMELVEHFIRRYSSRREQRVSAATAQLLQSYPWPGNVRELKNWVERACILCQDDVIDVQDIETVRGLMAAPKEVDLVDFEEKSLRTARAAFEKQFIERMLSENSGNVSKTAQIIGVERSHLHKKMKSYGIELKENN